MCRPDTHALDNLSEIDSSNDKQNIEEIKKLVTEVASSGNKISAPIKLPTPKDMEIRLVSVDSLKWGQVCCWLLVL